MTSKIVSRLNMSYQVPNPANKKENLNRHREAAASSFVEKLEALLSIADRALAAQTKTASAEIWSEAFNHFFPFPEDDDEEDRGRSCEPSNSRRLLHHDRFGSSCQRQRTAQNFGIQASPISRSESIPTP
jgi:hypothetical protein